MACSDNKAAGTILGDRELKLSFLKTPKWSFSTWVPSLRPAGPQEPGLRLPRARKLVKPQGLPFIAWFPLSSVPPGLRLSKFLPFSSLLPRRLLLLLLLLLIPASPSTSAGCRCSTRARAPTWTQMFQLSDPLIVQGRPPAVRTATLSIPSRPHTRRGSFSMGRGRVSRRRGE